MVHLSHHLSQISAIWPLHSIQSLIFIPTSTYPTLRLLLFSLGSPLGCLILSSLLELVSLLFGLVDGRLCVLSGSIDGEQAQRGWASVDDCLISSRIDWRRVTYSCAWFPEGQ